MLRKYPSLLLLAGVISGILTADGSRLHAVVFLLGSIVVAALGFWLWSMHRTRWAAVMFAAALGTVAAANFSRTVYDVPPDHISRVAADGQLQQILGRVSDWPEIRSSYTEVVLAVDSLGGRRQQRVSGSILLKITDTTTGLQRGDRVEFWGRIYPITAASSAPRADYGRYLNLKGVFGVVYAPTLLEVRIDRRSRYSFFAITDKLRDYIRQTLYDDLPSEAAALASGFLIGETRDIPTDVYQAFRNSGTLHLMAVSGSNVAVVLAFFYLLLQPFGFTRGKRTMVMLIVVAGFTALSYGEPSVLRASTMATLVLLATLLERRYDLNNITALAMLLILLCDPTQLYDVGFQLSFVTAWGLIFIVPRLTALFERYHNSRWYRWLAFPVIISLVAQVCSAPLIAYYFGQVPLISLGANLIIVPLASAALIMILLVLVAHFLLPAFGAVIGTMTGLLLSGTLEAVSFFGRGWSPVLVIDFGWSPLFSSLLIACIYILILLAVLALRSAAARRGLVFALLAAVNVGLAVAMGTHRPATGEILHLTTTPGGVSGLLVYRDRTADLLISNLAAKPYAMDQKIFQPMLSRHGVARLNRMFVLAASYEAIDDVLRLAEHTAVRGVFVSSDCGQSCREIVRTIGWPDSMFARLHFFGGTVPVATEGYNLEGNRISIWTRSGSVSLFGAGSPSRVAQAPAGTHILIIGKPWKATVTDWTSLRQFGYRDLICLKIAQPAGMRSVDEGLEAGAVPPDYIRELQKVGELDIRLADLSVVPGP